jgi:membrane protein implicated in regulation of membrane protease activity
MSVRMLTLYIASAIVAGVLILVSLFGGGDHEFGHDLGGDAHIDHGDSDHGGVGDWIPFFSLRFYTYFFAGLGATGLLLTFLTTTPASLILTLSLIVGAVSGTSVWLMIKLLRKTENTSTATEKDLMGKEATVMVGINGRNPGRIRCTVRGDIIEYLAIAEDGTKLNPGDTVVVLSMENGRAEVVARDTIFEPETLQIRN